MPRPPLAIGTYGKIGRRQQPNGTWQAETRYRDADGVTRKVRAHGTSGAKAEANLKDALKDRQHQAGGHKLTSRSPVNDLLDLWLADVEESDRTQSTKNQYRRTVEKTVRPALGKLHIREADTQAIDAFLKALPKDSTARAARVILKQAFTKAVIYKCVDVNPVTEAHTPKRPKPKPKALTADDIKELRRRTQAWQADQKAGPKRAHDIAELVDVMLGTGARIGEVLALRWQDIDDTTITIAGTITANGQRQPWTKTDAGHRTVRIPDFTAEALQRQRDRNIPYELVFPARTGKPRWPANIRSNWRKIRGNDYDWVTPHTLRRTVATLIERESGADTAAAQLGHTSADITRRHYIERAAEAPDSSHILQQLAPENAQ